MVIIAEKIGKDGRPFASDLSPGMLAVAQGKLKRRGIAAEFTLSNAAYLLLPDPKPIKKLSGLYDDEAPEFRLDRAIRGYDPRVTVDRASLHDSYTAHKEGRSLTGHASDGT